MNIFRGLVVALLFFNSIGYSQSHKISFSKKENDVKVDEFPTTTVGELLKMNEVENKVDGIIKLAPNPTNGKFTVRFLSKNKDKVLLTIKDLKGQLMYSREHQIISQTTQLEINDAKLKKGMYMLQLNLGSDEYNRKLIVY